MEALRIFSPIRIAYRIFLSFGFSFSGEPGMCMEPMMIYIHFPQSLWMLLKRAGRREGQKKTRKVWRWSVKLDVFWNSSFVIFRPAWRILQIPWRFPWTTSWSRYPGTAQSLHLASLLLDFHRSIGLGILSWLSLILFQIELILSQFSWGKIVLFVRLSLAVPITVSLTSRW